MLLDIQDSVINLYTYRLVGNEHRVERTEFPRPAWMQFKTDCALLLLVTVNINLIKTCSILKYYFENYI